jgi:hypothetical protein
MQDLKHANGATDQVTVSIFAWAEDVSLSIPTANEPGVISPQMGEVFTPQAKDEYGTGPISRPAGIIARAAGALKSAPGIGMYARATELAASATSSIATMFGYARPNTLADIEPYKPTVVGNLANTNVKDSCQKLTLDTKQELTIDSRTFGLGSADEMTILSIAQRESFLTQFGWQVADPAESLLWNTEVSPVLWNELEAGSEIHMPACCFAALPFKRWRGTMKFRFQIVASSFHKGRLKVVYDPSFPLSNEYNTNYTSIVDLAKERDFTVEVGWGNERAMCEHRHPLSDSIPYSEAPLSGIPGKSANGILSVYVVNDLTVPNSTVNNDIEVNVFVSVGDDFEVFDPDSRDIGDIVWFAPQMGELEVFTPQMAEINQPDADMTKKEDEPMKIDASMTLADNLSTADHTVSVYYGDPVVSFRQCLKRYNLHSVIVPSTVNLAEIAVTVRNSDFPYYRGYAPGAVHLSSVPAPSTPYNYCHSTLLNYLTPAFTCRRGGLRWKYVRAGRLASEQAIFAVRRCGTPLGGYQQQEEGVSPDGSTSERARQAEVLFPHMWDGGAATVSSINPVLETEIPFHRDMRFAPAKLAQVTEDTRFQSFHLLYTQWRTAASDATMIHCFSSVGEDFTLGFFTGAPVAYMSPKTLEPAAQPAV